MVTKYLIDTDYRRVIQASFQVSETISFDRYLQQYMTSVLAEEIRRFDRVSSF